MKEGPLNEFLERLVDIHRPLLCDNIGIEGFEDARGTCATCW